jgi:hypothetical protein
MKVNAILGDISYVICPEHRLKQICAAAGLAFFGVHHYIQAI